MPNRRASNLPDSKSGGHKQNPQSPDKVQGDHDRKLREQAEQSNRRQSGQTLSLLPSRDFALDITHG